MFFWSPVTEVGRILSGEQVLAQFNDFNCTNMLFRWKQPPLFPRVSVMSESTIQLCLSACKIVENVLKL